MLPSIIPAKTVQVTTFTGTDRQQPGQAANAAGDAFERWYNVQGGEVAILSISTESLYAPDIRECFSFMITVVYALRSAIGFRTDQTEAEIIAAVDKL